MNTTSMAYQLGQKLLSTTFAKAQKTYLSPSDQSGWLTSASQIDGAAVFIETQRTTSTHELAIAAYLGILDAYSTYSAAKDQALAELNTGWRDAARTALEKRETTP